MNQINFAACLKKDRRTVSSAFSGHTWPNFTQIQNCFKLNVSINERYMSKYNRQVKEKTLLIEWLGFLLLLIFGKLFRCLLLRRQRFITIFKLKERIFKNSFVKNIAHIF